jgi:hypothetical protein
MGTNARPSEDAERDGQSAGVEPGLVEPRWPIALAISVFVAITIGLRILEPHHESLGPPWLVPGIEIAMLVMLILADPTRVMEQRRWLRRVSLALVLSLAVVVFVSTVVLVTGLIEGGKVTQSAGSLLTSGALVWLGNGLVFGLLYWLLDGGGPVARYRRERPYLDFAFSQQQSPELSPPGWLPHYVDYLVLGVTTSMAFSPTDVLPLSAWAKLMMALQSMISLVVVGLVIARAVNVLP